MIKAGYKGSTINEIVWMGDVVNKACKLAGYGNKNGNNVIVSSEDFHNNLRDEYKKIFIKNFFDSFYHSYQNDLTHLIQSGFTLSVK